MQAEHSRPETGEPAPDFTLEEAGGSAVGLKDLRGRAVVLVFYRGGW